MEKVLLPKLKRFLQDPSCCAWASVASVGNFFNRKIDYDFVCGVMEPDGNGLYTPSIAMLLNEIGFKEVTVVSADLDQLDFCWKGLTKNKLILELKRCRRSPRYEYREQVQQYIEFLEDKENRNNLVIDMHFGNHIREALDNGLPVLISFNWNLFFNYPKWNDNREVDPIKGEFEQHEVVVYGYDDKGVNILDSHHEMYKGKLRKFRSGRYKMDWETLMTVMGTGDLIIPGGYSIERANEQLVSSDKES